jgi:hypothetical protein
MSVTPMKPVEKEASSARRPLAGPAGMKQLNK